MLGREYEGEATIRRPSQPYERDTLLMNPQRDLLCNTNPRDGRETLTSPRPPIAAKPLPPPPEDYTFNLQHTLQVRKMNPQFVPPPTVNPSVVSSNKNLYGGPETPSVMSSNKNIYGGGGAEVSDMLRTIQSELDTLKESVRTGNGSKASESCFYERIDDLHRSPRTSTKSRRDYVVQTARDRGLFRVRTIVDPATGHCARFIWILLLVASLTLLSYQLYDRVTLYFRFPSHTTIETLHLDTIPFPVITICNLNKFRLTKAVNLSVYHPLHHILHHSHPLNYSGVVQSLGKINLSYADLLAKATHKREDTIYSCRFKGQNCERNDVTDSFTDHGRCFTFKKLGRNRDITRTGLLTGLSLVINVEQYDYLLGPKSAVGVRVTVRDSDTQTITDANTINVPVGKYTTLDVSKVKRQELPSKHNNCGTTSATPSSGTQPGQSHDACIRACKDQYFIQRCSCVPLKSQHANGNYRECSVSEYYACALTGGRKIEFDDSYCGCPRDCLSTEYEVMSSQASISSYGAESSVRNFQGRFDLEQRYKRAMDTYHRMDTTIFHHDLLLLKRIPKELEDTTRREEFTSYLTQYDKTQNEHVSASVDRLNKTLNKLSDIVKFDFTFFETPTHIGFTAYGGRIKDELNAIIGLESSLTQKFNVAPNDPDVITIIKTIGKIVNLEKESDQSAFVYTKEIDSGIVSFRRKLFHGYGSHYEEFINNKEFYTNITQLIQNRVSNITNILKSQHKSLTSMSTRDSMNVLTKFFWHIRNLRDNDMPPLIKQLDTILSEYNKHRVKVLHFIRSLPAQSKRLIENLGIWRHNLSSFGEAVASLPISLSSLRTEMTTLAIAYDNKRFGKVELAQKLQSQTVSGPLRQAQTDLQRIAAMADDLSAKGSQVASIMVDQKLTSRLVDFELAKKKDMDDLLKWIQFKPLKVQVSEYVQETDDKLRLIRTYREELQEYVDSIRIDESFYRNNFLHLDVNIKDLTETVITQQKSYSILDLACDIGGAMALCLGASLLTIFDIAEFIEKCVYYYLVKN